MPHGWNTSGRGNGTPIKHSNDMDTYANEL